jgi:hypothetical protein
MIGILMDWMPVCFCGKITFTTRAGEHGFRLPKRDTRLKYF